MPVGLILQALPMPRTLDPRKADELAHIVEALGGAASFRNVLRAAARARVLKENKTLRRYLDLLVRGKVLKMRTRDVGSVNLQQLYTVSSRRPEIWVGLGALRIYGLNWEVPETELQPLSTDYHGLVRSRAIDTKAMASLEDCLIHELHRDANGRTGGISFVIAIISTRALDLPYLLRRADEKHLGKTMRFLLNRILKIVSSRQTDVAASVFIAVREQFLKIVRRYTQTGFWKLVDEKGVGDLGIQTAIGLSDYEVIMSAGKQLGVTG
jgi:hypothetical protein